MQTIFKSLSILLVVCIVVLSCSKTRTQNEKAEFLIGVNVTELTNDTLDEVSGMEASVSNPGMFWVHNDSGGDPKIFLIDSLLEIKLQVTIAGVKNIDWEDIAVGPGPEDGKTYVYVGEIGDNRAKRKQKKIYRFEEPAFKRDTALSISAFDTITFQLPDKKKDTESLMIDPLTKDLYLVSKREEPVHLYQLKYPQSVTEIITATDVTTIPLTQITAADISDDGTEILLKNYRFVYYWKRQVNESIGEVLQSKPQLLSYNQEPQGEAITWAHDGGGFYTLSESSNLDKTYLLFYKRKSESQTELSAQ